MSTDSIDSTVAQKVGELLAEKGFPEVHTVLIELNGQHGGVDVTITNDNGSTCHPIS